MSFSVNFRWYGKVHLCTAYRLEFSDTGDKENEPEYEKPNRIRENPIGPTFK